MDQEYNVSTVAKSGTVTFNAPWQGGFDLSGIYYVANKALNNIIKITQEGTCSVFSTETTFKSPMSVTFDSNGNMYIADRDNKAVKKITSGGTVTNYDMSSLKATYGYAWSPKRITLSTVGLRKGLQRFIEENDCHLAISLHSPLTVQRAELMPAEKAFSITEMVELLKNYDFSKQRRLSFEYIVFKGLNDSQVYAKELLKLLRGLDCRVNLIRFHAIPGVDLEGADMDTMTRFRDYLTSHGLFTTIRSSRGEDIFAACGMLSTAKQEKNNES